MSDAAFRMFQGQVNQLVDKLNLTWKVCPRNWASYTEEEQDGHPHAFGYCSEGLVTNGYSSEDRVCKECHGAGDVLAQKSVDA